MLILENRMKELRREILERRQADLSDLVQRAYEGARDGYSFYFEASPRSSSSGCGGPRVGAVLPPTLEKFQAYLNSEASLQ
ncbi:hypothetical protein, partial [Streptomyces galilaeus]|uniref:hypothetical protein n=1 Tax=Streptomyces galilaeus TaxID=33899 RepID=UPI0038F75A6E